MPKSVDVAWWQYTVRTTSEALFFNRRPVPYMIFHHRREILVRRLPMKFRIAIAWEAVYKARDEAVGMLFIQMDDANGRGERLILKPLPCRQHEIVGARQIMCSEDVGIVCPHCFHVLRFRDAMYRHLLKEHGDVATVASFVGADHRSPNRPLSTQHRAT